MGPAAVDSKWCTRVTNNKAVCGRFTDFSRFATRVEFVILCFRPMQWIFTIYCTCYFIWCEWVNV